jgi:hypothetical protein
MNYFCTYFDINYLPRALCLLDSLEQHCSAFIIYMLCLDEVCYERVKGLGSPHVIPVSLPALEAADEELATVREGRSLLEYYYTCGPAFISWTLRTHPEVELLTYIDADTYFYSDPSILLSELAENSIGITVHRFVHSPPQGRYNVGWISFRRDRDGMDCVNWWRARCIEWCYERFEDGKYADQKYLDEWPTRFHGVKVIDNRGANVAPWNVRDYRIRLDGNLVTVDDDPLIFFHFHGFKRITPWLYNTNLGLTFRFPSRVLIKYVYRPYIQSIKRYSGGLSPTASIRRKHLRHPLVQTIRDIIRIAIGIVFHQYVVVVEGRVL